MRCASLSHKHMMLDMSPVLSLADLCEILIIGEDFHFDLLPCVIGSRLKRTRNEYLASHSVERYRLALGEVHESQVHAEREPFVVTNRLTYTPNLANKMSRYFPRVMSCYRSATLLIQDWSMPYFVARCGDRKHVMAMLHSPNCKTIHRVGMFMGSLEVNENENATLVLITEIATVVQERHTSRLCAIADFLVRCDVRAVLSYNALEGVVCAAFKQPSFCTVLGAVDVAMERWQDELASAYNIHTTMLQWMVHMRNWLAPH